MNEMFRTEYELIHLFMQEIFQENKNYSNLRNDNLIL